MPENRFNVTMAEIPPVLTVAPRVVRNPSGLTPTAYRHIGNDRAVPVTDAVQIFNVNPFLEGTENWREWFRLVEAREQERLEPFLKLENVPIIRLPSKRRLEQPLLKFDFDNLHDIRLRVVNGGIFIGSEMYYVQEAYPYEDDFMLIVRNARNEAFKCQYKRTEAIDLRSPEPQYITYDGQPSYLVRPPYKQQRQAINVDNTKVKDIGSSYLNNCDPRVLMRGLTRDTLAWSPYLADLIGRAKAIKAIRLSKELCAYRNDDDETSMEYRGRYLGEINDNTVTVDELDFARPWIKRDVSMIGFDLRRQT